MSCWIFYDKSRQECIVYNFRDTEERIAERIDANLLDCTIDELYDMPKKFYDDKIKKMQK